MIFRGNCKLLPARAFGRLLATLYPCRGVYFSAHWKGVINGPIFQKLHHAVFYFDEKISSMRNPDPDILEQFSDCTSASRDD